MGKRQRQAGDLWKPGKSKGSAHPCLLGNEPSPVHTQTGKGSLLVTSGPTEDDGGWLLRR